MVSDEAYEPVKANAEFWLSCGVRIDLWRKAHRRVPAGASALRYRRTIAIDQVIIGSCTNGRPRNEEIAQIY